MKRKRTTHSTPQAKRSDLVIVSNRLPVHRVRRGNRWTWETSPGGLVSALKPILRDRSSTWIGWTGAIGRAQEPFTHDGIRNIPIRMSDEDVRCFYEGFSNRTLWPLYHDAVRTPEFRRYWWWPYIEVNRRFAEAAAACATPDGIVWVHDYHLQLVPAMLRELNPNLRIGFFLHIPFPPQELFSQLPWRQQILEGLLGADVIGFQTKLGAMNLVALAKRFTSARGGRILEFKDREIHVDSFPVSIDFELFDSTARRNDVLAKSHEFRTKLGKSRKIILGVDRMDYTKGIDIRMNAYRSALTDKLISPDESVFVQIAVPSRERVEEYKQLRAVIEQLVGEINGEFGRVGAPAIHYLHRSFGLDELVAMYRTADVMLVTPLRDGMNLVAKEYAATRTDERGVLVLSEFTGSARELTDAILVNPHDLDGLATTLATVINLPEDEQQRRMRALRRTVRRNDVYRWADTFFAALAS